MAGFITFMQDEITRDLVEVDQQINVWFEWNGTAYACVPDKFTREVLVTDDGNPEQIDLSLRVRVELFPNHQFPKSGDRVQFPVAEDGSALLDTATYKVRRTRSKQFAMLWVDCVDLNV
jgi:hypothetical protein